MTVRLTWDITLNDAKERLAKLQTPLKALTRAIAGRLEASTHERFETETAPDGKAWKKSNKPGGKTLTATEQAEIVGYATSAITGVSGLIIIGRNLYTKYRAKST